MIANDISMFEILNLGKRENGSKYFIYIGKEELIIFENHDFSSSKSLSYTNQLKMTVLYSTDSKKIESISLYDESSFFQFNFSHMHLEKLELIFKLLKKKIFLNGFNSNFKIKKMLGEGAYGKVHLAENIFEKKLYAVKSISKNIFKLHKRTWIAIRNEIKVLKELNHQNMVCLDSIYEEDDAILIVMDYLPGGTLKDYIKTHGVLTEKQSLIILKALLKMLEYLNGLGIIHRDLKPENIMLREPTISPENLVLIDFGFSVFMRETPYEFKRCGTPGFIAPEILHLKDNEPMYGAKSDIFSVGVIWYYCLFGCLPFKARSSEELLSKNKKGEFIFEKSTKFQKTANSIKMLLEKNPNDRIDLKTALETDFLFNILCEDDDTDELDGGLLSRNIEKLNNITLKFFPPLYISNWGNSGKTFDFLNDAIISEKFKNKGDLSFKSSRNTSKNSTLLCSLRKSENRE